LNNFSLPLKLVIPTVSIRMAAVMAKRLKKAVTLKAPAIKKTNIEM
jgi:hypothetical protein